MTILSSVSTRVRICHQVISSKRAKATMIWRPFGNVSLNSSVLLIIPIIHTRLVSDSQLYNALLIRSIPMGEQRDRPDINEESLGTLLFNETLLDLISRRYSLV